jgi:hypothetical protein
VRETIKPVASSRSDRMGPIGFGTVLHADGKIRRHEHRIGLRVSQAAHE